MLVGAFNQEKALVVGAFSVITKLQSSRRFVSSSTSWWMDSTDCWMFVWHWLQNVEILRWWRSQTESTGRKHFRVNETWMIRRWLMMDGCSLSPCCSYLMDAAALWILIKCFLTNSLFAFQARLCCKERLKRKDLKITYNKTWSSSPAWNILHT